MRLPLRSRISSVESSSDAVQPAERAVAGGDGAAAALGGGAARRAASRWSAATSAFASSRLWSRRVRLDFRLVDALNFCFMALIARPLSTRACRLVLGADSLGWERGTHP